MASDVCCNQHLVWPGCRVYRRQLGLHAAALVVGKGGEGGAGVGSLGPGLSGTEPRLARTGQLCRFLWVDCCSGQAGGVPWHAHVVSKA